MLCFSNTNTNINVNTNTDTDKYTDTAVQQFSISAVHQFSSAACFRMGCYVYQIERALAAGWPHTDTGRVAVLPNG